ncbi:uncharacterized protein Dana_GF16424 [Drosophila ananassae]|uniref:SLC41A/MgtE integral membrane domain-containing protein n=1 Tax=Drosophila ananassae TaxID=7217 RepID=B3LVA8_DROAN|nr:solute carrier family 41 member 1 [Drosophila ananassae]EDV43640.1 uncharacterized protein Dana_GF16424 [Drosophila ananassae]
MANTPDPLKPAVSSDEIYQERWYSTFIQIAIPFFLAGTGTICAGLLLGNVQDWTVYREMNELFVLVSVLGGLKGNLDMCVAARMCTHSNMGQLSDRSSVIQILVGNMALVQLQAIVCAIFLSSIATLIHFVVQPDHERLKHFPIVTSSALLTASISCFILDSILMSVILFSQKYHFNPDYMATPFVASLGDVVTISMLSFTAAVLYELSESHSWVCICLMAFYIFVLLPLWLTVVLRNSYVRPILMTSWIPVIGALCISQVAGFVLSFTVDDFRGIAVFSPIINGIGGNMVSVQSSNMGSILHQRSELGQVPEDTRILEWPHRVYYLGTIYSRVSRILIAISVPGNVILVYVADYLYMSYISVRWPFLVGFVITSLFLLLILLWIAHALVHLLWWRKIDPDTAAIPYLTALGDALGTGLLAIMFHLLRLANEEYQTKQLPWLRLNYDSLRGKAN